MAASRRTLELRDAPTWEFELATDDVACWADTSVKPRIYKAQALLPGTRPSEIAAVLSDLPAWDSWFRTIERLDDLADGATHLYCTLSGGKDLSLVQRQQTLEDGTIMLASTSVASTRCPITPAAKRVSLKLSSWVLHPVDADDQSGVVLTWFLQAHKGAFLGALSTKRAMPKHMAA